MNLCNGRLILAVLLALALAASVEAGEKSKRVDLLGDPLPPGAIARFGTVRFRHGGIIRALAYSSNGKLLASGGDDGTVRIWDTATGRAIHQFNHGSAVRSLVFSPNNEFVASSGGDASIHLWDVAKGKDNLEMMGLPLACLAFSPDGKLLACGCGVSTTSSGARQMVFEVKTGKPIKEWTGFDFATAIAFSPDGRFLISSNDNETLRWDMASGKALGWPGGKGFALSRDGKTSVSRWADLLQLWDVDSGKPTRQLSLDFWKFHSLAFSLDGKMVATAQDDWKIWLWNAATGKIIRKLDVNIAASCLAFSADGKKLAAAGNHVIRIWDVDSGKEISPASTRHGHGGPLTSLSLSPDGKTVATSSDDGTLRCWETGSGKQRLQVAGHGGKALYACVFSADGKSVWSAGWDNALRLWDLASQKELRSLSRDLSVFNGIAFSADGKMAAIGTGSKDGTVFLWDLPAGKRFARYDGWRATAFAPDSPWFIHQGPDGELHLCDLSRGRLVRRFSKQEPGIDQRPVAFSADGRTLATVERSGGAIGIWEMATAKQRLSVTWTTLVPVPSFAFSPDGRYLAVAAGKTIELCDLATGKTHRWLKGHVGDVIGVAFSHDGRMLASASSDTTALIWDVAPRGKRTVQAIADNRVEQLWEDLARPNAAAAYKAMWLLTDAPDQAVDLFKRRCRPVPAVPVERWIAQLDDKVFAVREKATAELASHGEQAEMALRQVRLKSPSLEVNRRIDRLLAQYASTEWRFSADSLRTIRCIEVLERIGTAEARAVLKNLTQGAPAAWATREAHASLRRLAKRR